MTSRTVAGGSSGRGFVHVRPSGRAYVGSFRAGCLQRPRGDTWQVRAALLSGSDERAERIDVVVDRGEQSQRSAVGHSDVGRHSARLTWCKPDHGRATGGHTLGAFGRRAAADASAGDGAAPLGRSSHSPRSISSSMRLCPPPAPLFGAGLVSDTPRVGHGRPGSRTPSQLHVADSARLRSSTLARDEW